MACPLVCRPAYRPAYHPVGSRHVVGMAVSRVGSCSYTNAIVVEVGTRLRGRRADTVAVAAVLRLLFAMEEAASVVSGRPGQGCRVAEGHRRAGMEVSAAAAAEEAVVGGSAAARGWVGTAQAQCRPVGNSLALTFVDVLALLDLLLM